MNKVWAILRYEYKMQLSRPAVWGIFAGALLLSMLDNFPSAANLARLEFLTQPAYFIYRVMAFDGLLLIFGLMFVISGRIPGDDKLGMKSLFLAAPVSRGQYAAGKLLGAAAVTFSTVTLFLTVSAAIYAVFSPEKAGVRELIGPLAITLLVCGLPVSFFAGVCSAALPALMDVRLFYLLAAALFLVNASSVGSAESVPFWMITSGDLMKIVWHHPKFPFTDRAGIMANFLFLVGTGVVTWVAMLLKRSFWREKV